EQRRARGNLRRLTCSPDDDASVPVRDLRSATAFCEAVLATIGFVELHETEGTCGFTTRHPELWLNARPCLEHEQAPGSTCASGPK
ncbi:MAG: hypothetical protein AAGF92_17270, partial [Myxococcota bacterium]